MALPLIPIGLGVAGALGLLGTASSEPGNPPFGERGGSSNTIDLSGVDTNQPNPFVSSIPVTATAGGPPSPPEFPGASGGGGSLAQSAGLNQLAEAQQQAAAALASLDKQFEQRKEMLKGQYELSETPEEKANIQHLLDIIEVQRDEGTKVIERVYGEAIEGSAERADAVRDQGAESADRTAQRFQDVAGETSEMLSGLNEEFGGFTGAGGAPMSPVTEATLADMARQGASEAAFNERMFGVSADDIDFLGQAMRPEMGAQVGALQRDAATTSALSQFEHDQRVQDRIAQERMAQAQALQQLAGQFDQRAWGLQDQQIALQGQAAQMQQSGTQQLTPQEEFELELAMRDYEREQANFERQQQAAALRGLGAGPAADFATQIGLGQELGGTLLRGQFDPETRLQMEQLQNIG